VNGPDNYARDTPLQVALREIRVTASEPRFWIGMGAVIAILAVAAPFDTGDSLSFPALIAYWGLIAVCTFFIAMPVAAFFGEWCMRLGMPEAMAWISGGVASSVPVFAFVMIVNVWIIGFPPNEDQSLPLFYLYVLAISVAMSVIYYLVSLGDETGAAEGITPMRSPFFDRLPGKLGTDIISLQAQDHYLKVTTATGREMILMRLADAEKELESAGGLRVHRSWWVAQKHISELKRDGDRQFLEMSNGEEIPVSRSYAKTVRAALGK